LLRAAADHVEKSISAELTSSKYCDFILRAHQNTSTFPLYQNTCEQDPLNNSTNQAGLVLSIRIARFPSDCFKTENCSSVTTKMQPVDESDILLDKSLQQELEFCYPKVKNTTIKRLILVLASKRF